MKVSFLEAFCYSCSMNINWYSFYDKISSISVTLLILGLFILTPFLINDDNNFFDTSWFIPYLVITFVVTVFSWLMTIKYKALRHVPETTTKQAGRLYGVIGISLILLFFLFLIALPLIFQ